MSKTYGEMMKEALVIKTQEEADEWFKKEVEFMQEANPSWSLTKCADVVQSNLGYMAGYYDKSASEHVKKFFGTNHPIFGDPSYLDSVSPKEAFEKGKSYVKRDENGR